MFDQSRWSVRMCLAAIIFLGWGVDSGLFLGSGVVLVHLITTSVIIVVGASLLVRFWLTLDPWSIPIVGFFGCHDGLLLLEIAPVEGLVGFEPTVRSPN